MLGRLCEPPFFWRRRPLEAQLTILMSLTTCRRSEAEGAFPFLCRRRPAAEAYARGRFLITMTLRSNPSFFFYFYRNFALLFTTFLHFWSFYGILTCFAQNNTVIISIFLQRFPIIYIFYGKTAPNKTLFTVILFWLLPISFSFHNHKKVSLII